MYIYRYIYYVIPYLIPQAGCESVEGASHSSSLFVVLDSSVICSYDRRIRAFFRQLNRSTHLSFSSVSSLRSMYLSLSITSIVRDWGFFMTLDWPKSSDVSEGQQGWVHTWTRLTWLACTRPCVSFSARSLKT